MEPKITKIDILIRLGYEIPNLFIKSAILIILWQTAWLLNLAIKYLEKISN